MSDDGNVAISPHALQRYHERVRPALDRKAARDDLVRMIAAHGRVMAEAPEWARKDEVNAEAWLWLTDEIVFPLRRPRHGSPVWAAITCLTPSAYGAKMREYRSRARRNARAARHARSADQGKRQRGRMAKANRAPERRWKAEA